MALRVLLADESPTIKKVFQLALQDYAVEVTSVNLGLDVVTVSKNFQPDIIFADVLLQKKNGYEVCNDVRADAHLKDTPVVLMWSGFMDFDESRFQACGASGRIEKPFDVEALRKIIKENVPKTQTQNLSDYLTFPNMPKIEEEQKPESTPQPAQQASGPQKDWNMDNFQGINENAEEPSDNENFGFEEMPLQPRPQATQQSSANEEDSLWVQSNAGNFQSPPTLDNTFAGTIAVNEPNSEFNAPVSAEQDLLVEDPYEINEFELNPPIEPLRSKIPTPQQPSMNAIDIEKFIEQTCKKTLEDMIKEMLPRLATEVIQEEIQKLIEKQP